MHLICINGNSEFLWYIPNQVTAGHRGDAAAENHNSLDTLTGQAKALEEHGWKGALIGTGWGRPAHFASAAAALDHLTSGRVWINIVSGKDDLAAYGDQEADQAHRYARTKEFMHLVRRLWTEENVTYAGEHFRVTEFTVVPRNQIRGDRRHPKLYFGGASEAAERVVATDADVQLFWGEPLDGVRERIQRLRAFSRTLDRDLPPLEFGLRITALVRDTTERAWADAEAKVAETAKAQTGRKTMAGARIHHASPQLGTGSVVEGAGSDSYRQTAKYRVVAGD